MRGLLKLVLTILMWKIVDLGKYANKHPSVVYGLLMGFGSFVGIIFGIWLHVWPIVLIWSVLSFIGFIFAFASFLEPRE